MKTTEEDRGFARADVMANRHVSTTIALELLDDLDAVMRERDELAREVARLTEALEAALADRERRCDVCGEPATYKRARVMLVGLPNRACAEHITELGPWPEPSDYQPPIVAIIRAALRGGPAPSGGGEEKS